MVAANRSKSTAWLAPDIGKPRFDELVIPTAFYRQRERADRNECV
jgi:hypothetical protein